MQQPAEVRKQFYYLDIFIMLAVSWNERIMLILSVLHIYDYENVTQKNDVTCFMFIFWVLFAYWQTGEQVGRIIWPDTIIWHLGESKIKPALVATKKPVHLFC